MNDDYTWGEDTASVAEIQKVVDKVRNEVQKVIIGQDDLIELIMVSVFCRWACFTRRGARCSQNVSV